MPRVHHAIGEQASEAILGALRCKTLEAAAKGRMLSHILARIRAIVEMPEKPHPRVT